MMYHDSIENVEVYRAEYSDNDRMVRDLTDSLTDVEERKEVSKNCLYLENQKGEGLYVVSGEEGVLLIGESRWVEDITRNVPHRFDDASFDHISGFLDPDS